MCGELLVLHMPLQGKTSILMSILRDILAAGPAEHRFSEARVSGVQMEWQLAVTSCSDIRQNMRSAGIKFQIKFFMHPPEPNRAPGNDWLHAGGCQHRGCAGQVLLRLVCSICEYNEQC